jgi:hypothetical protein
MSKQERIQKLFHAAAELPSTEREAFLVGACGTDDALMCRIFWNLLDLGAHARKGFAALDGNYWANIHKNLIILASARV